MADPRGVVITEVAFTDDPTVESPAWTDVSAYVKSSSCTRGRGSELEQVQPGTWSGVFRNNDRTFDPSYANGPYYGYLLPMRKIRQRIDRQGYSISEFTVTQSDAVTDAIRAADTSGDGQPLQPFDFVGGFETGGYDEWDANEAGEPGVQFSPVTNPVRDGNFALKVTVRSGDVAGGAERGEVMWNSSNEQDGDERFYGWSDYLPSSWVGPTGGDLAPGGGGGFKLVWQLHDDTSTGPPVVQIRYDTDSAKLRLNTGVVDGSGIGTNYTDYSLLSSLAKEEWHDWIIQIRFRTGATGLVNVWHKMQSDATYTLLRTVTGVPTLQSAGAGPASAQCYMKKGLYRTNESYTDTYYTDAMRVGRSFYDIVSGLLSSDSSYGIWPASKNLVTNGNATTNTTNITTLGTGTGNTRETTELVFGSTRIRTETLVSAGVGAGVTYRSAAGLQAGGDVASGATLIGSIFAQRTSSTNAIVRCQVRITYTDATSTDSTAIVYSLGDYPKRLVSAPITANGAKTIDIVRVMVLTTGVAQSTAFWTGGAQVETGSFPTPYIATDGAVASRAAARVQAPAITGTLDETQGWMAMVVREGVDYTATGDRYYWLWGDDVTNRLRLIWDDANDWYLLERRNSGGGSSKGFASAYPRGGQAFILCSWDATQLHISVDGAAFQSVANTNIPTLAATTFDVGSNAGASQVSGDVKWLAWGTGTISDADASAMYEGYGKYYTDPLPSDSVWPATASVAASWPAFDGRVFANDSAYLFTGYVESWGQSWPDRLFISDTTVTASDAFKVLNLVGQPTSNPNVEGYEDVVSFEEPAWYGRLGEPEGTKVVHHVRKVRRKLSAGGGEDAPYHWHKKRIHWKTRVTRSEVEGVSGPAGTYKNTPTLAEPGAIAGDANTSVRFTAASSEYAVVLLEDGDLGATNRITLEVWVKLASVIDQNFLSVDFGIAGSNATLGMSAAGAFRFFVFDGASSATASGPSTATTGVWYHLVGSYNGSVNGTRLLINGALAATDNGVSFVVGTAPKIYIGRTAAGGDHTNGWLDEPVIYEKPLSDARALAHYTAGTRGFAQELTGTRIANAINATGLPIPQNLDNGSRDILPVRQFGQKTLQPVDEAVDVEGGPSIFFFAADGTATFFDRDYKTKALHANSAVTIGDGLGDDVAMEDVDIADDESVLFNQVRVEASGGETQEANDGPSQDRFFTRTMEISGVLMTSDADALEEAEELLERYKDPQQRIRSVVINPGMEESAQEQAVIRELGDHITVIRRPLGGDAITQDSYIQSISHEINFEAGDWHTTFALDGTATPAITGATYFGSHLKVQTIPPIRVRSRPLSHTYLPGVSNPGGPVRLTRTR